MLVVFAAGTAVASNALLIGEVSKRAGAGERGVASGVIGAGGPAGQLLLAPIVTAAIATQGWVAAMCALGAIALLALPLARSFAARPAAAASAHRSVGGEESLRDVRFWLIAGSFAVCGFHVAFLAVHMPGVIERCGLPASFTGLWLVLAGAANMAGSLGIGLLMKRFASAPLLALVYGLRVASIVVFLFLPSSGGVLLAFALAMGLTYTATLPPTAELIARSFGVERLSRLLGAAMLLHQVGGFFGAWLGGVAIEHSGSYAPLWIADAALAAFARGAAVRSRPHHGRTAQWSEGAQSLASTVRQHDGRLIVAAAVEAHAAIGERRGASAFQGCAGMIARPSGHWRCQRST